MNILEMLSYSHLIFQLCSLSQMQVEKKTWLPLKSRALEIYTFAVLLLSIVILLLGIFIPSLNANNSGDIGGTVDFIQLIGIRVAHIVSIAESLIRRKELQKLMKQIQEIDRIFEIALNVDTDNGKMRSETIHLGLGMLALYMGSEACILTTSALGPNAKYAFFWVLYLIPLVVCGMRYFQYLVFVSIIKRRIEKLTEVLGDVNLWHKSKDKGIVKVEAAATIKLMKHLDQTSKPLHVEPIDLSNLLTIRDLYNRLWEVTMLVNKCFGLSILVNVGNDFLTITSNCYWIFLNFTSYSSTYIDFFRITGSAIWCMPHIFNIVALAMMCHKTIETTLEIALGVHRIEIDILNDYHNSMIEQFSLQLLHQKIKFTAFGFFTIDCTLLYTIVGATTTYLIILIQFHMNEQRDYSPQVSNPALVNVSQ